MQHLNIKWAGKKRRSIPLALALLAAGIGAFAVDIIAPPTAGESQHGETAITCANPASGATWRIRIDYDNRAVDSNPARISDTQISWYDATDGGNYTLDRKSGKLTVIVASSTGGYFIHDSCSLEN
jgi:hypothetical protein